MTESVQAAMKAAGPLSVVVVGASGDLSRRKIFPALFSLYCRGLLPREFRCLGFSRTEMSDEAFREKLTENLTCRYTPEESCAEIMAEFLRRCDYVAGAYDSAEDYARIDGRLREAWGGRAHDRIFYLAIPPFLFLPVARAVAAVWRGEAAEETGWSRVVIEKPFGRDRESSDELARGLAGIFSEEDTYRIDHYLGKTVIQNLMVLRFANLIFEPIWNRRYIANVQLHFCEDLAVGDRGGYFDQYGIVRDVMQNHLLQALALMAMEPPIGLAATHVRDEKAKLLRSMPPALLESMALGQYRETKVGQHTHRAYVDEPSVPDDSLTPTFAAAVLWVRNARWDGVPFYLSAGKGLNRRATEIHVQFQPAPGNIFARAAEVELPGDLARSLPANRLVIRVQPDEAIDLHVVNKHPGMAMMLTERALNLRYDAAFEQELPDAYETLLLDVVRGDKSLFIRADELEAAWDIFTPALHELEKKRVRPEPYPFGSSGPQGAWKLAQRFGVTLP